MMVTANSFPVEVPTTPVARFFSPNRGGGGPQIQTPCVVQTPFHRAEPPKNLGAARSPRKTWAWIGPKPRENRRDRPGSAQFSSAQGMLVCAR